MNGLYSDDSAKEFFFFFSVCPFPDLICGEDNGAGTTFLGDVWVPSVAHFKIPLEGNPTRPDRPGDMYDAETVGAEKDSGPVTAVAINGIGIQVFFSLQL